MAEEKQTAQKPIIARKFKDSVFTHLFRQPEYTLQLYQALHPEDTETTISDIHDVTHENILVRIKITPRPPKESENADCAKQLAIWNYTIQPRNEEEQIIAAKMDAEEILAEKTHVKRKYTKKQKLSN